VALGQRQQILQKIPNTLLCVVQQNNIRLELWGFGLVVSFTRLFFPGMAHRFYRKFSPALQASNTMLTALGNRLSWIFLGLLKIVSWYAFIFC
jgi:hypothetical protein